MGTVMLLFVLLEGTGSAQSVISRQADTAKKCAICHYRWVAAFFLEGRSTPIASANVPDDVVGRPEMCLSCHDGSVRDSRDKICNDPGHRIGIRPSNRVKIPENFPLDDNGCMQCTTCHTPHAVPKREGHLVDFFLRAPNRDSSFCALCHQNHAGGLDNGNHPLGITVPSAPLVILRSGGRFGGEHGNRIICETCHIPHGGVSSSFLLLPAEDTQTLSILCETCHTQQPDKTNAKGSAFSHPVDIQPGGRATVPAKWPTGEPLIRGTRGGLVCRTCHRPHQATSKQSLLTGPPGKDAQCLCCHPAQASVQGTPHDLRRHPSGSSGICSPCHAVHEAPVKEYLWAAPRGRPFLSEHDREIAGGTHNLMVSLCTGCHDQGGIAAAHVPRDGLHPEAFSARLPGITAQLQKNRVYLYDGSGRPSAQGSIACATCHDAHRWGDTAASRSDLVQKGASSKGFLRKAVSKNLCAACHGAEGLFKYLHFHTRTGRTHKKAPFPFGEQ